MKIRLICIVIVLALATCCILGQVGADGLQFGQVYGTAGFLSVKPSGTMMEAPNVVLAFRAEDGHRNLVLTQQTGDYIALLEPGRYCLGAYTRAGKALQLSQNQQKCFVVATGNDVRLDVMLVRESR